MERLQRHRRQGQRRPSKRGVASAAGGRPPKDNSCIVVSCSFEKVKGSPCCGGHKPDYQNLYNDAKRENKVDGFHEAMKTEIGSQVIAEAHEVRIGEAQAKIQKINWAQWTVSSSKKKVHTDRIKYK